MTSTPLDYDSTRAPGTSFFRHRRKAIVPICISAVVIASLLAQLRREDRWTDPVTGSHKRKTWVFGVSLGSRVEASPLELRLKASGIHWTPSWRFTSGNEGNIYGMWSLCACGHVPPIYYIHGVLKDIADTSTDAELVEFVRIMQTGSDAQQEAAIQAAFQTVLNRWRGGG